MGPGKDTHIPVHWGLNSKKAVAGPFGSDSRYTENTQSVWLFFPSSKKKSNNKF